MEQRRSFLLCALSVAAVVAGIGAIRPGYVDAGQNPLSRALRGPGCLDKGCNVPFQKALDFEFLPDTNVVEAEQKFVVPAKRRLVIEYVSSSWLVEGPGLIVRISTFAGGATVTHTIPATVQTLWVHDNKDDHFNRNNMAVGQVTRLYAEPGTVVHVIVDRTRTYLSHEGFGVQVAISGILEEAE